MKAVILAAGEGSRLRPLTQDRPKPMLPVAGKPVLEHIVGWLRDYGVTDVAVNLHHCPQVVQAHFGDGAAFGVHIRYAIEPVLLGTAGMLANFADFLDEPFVLVYGDVLTDLPLDALVAFHTERSTQDDAALMTLSLYRVPDPTACGIVALDETGRITRFVEKPIPVQVFSNLASTGVLVVNPAILELIEPGRFADFGFHILPTALAQGRPLYGWEIPAHTYLIDMGTPAQYAQAQVEWPRVHGPLSYPS